MSRPKFFNEPMKLVTTRIGDLDQLNIEQTGVSPGTVPATTLCRGLIAIR